MRAWGLVALAALGGTVSFGVPAAGAHSCGGGEPGDVFTTPEEAVAAGNVTRIGQLVSVRRDQTVEEQPYLGKIRVLVAFGTAPAERQFEVLRLSPEWPPFHPDDVGRRYFFYGELPSQCAPVTGWIDHQRIEQLVGLASAHGVAVYRDPAYPPRPGRALLVPITLGGAMLAIVASGLVVVRRVASGTVDDRPTP